MAGQAFAFDTLVRAALHSLASRRMTYLMRGLTWLGSPAFLVTLGTYLVWRLALQGRRRAAFLLVMASIGAEALDQLLKLVFHRSRPEPYFGYHAAGYSFP